MEMEMDQGKLQTTKRQFYVKNVEEKPKH